MTAYLRNLQRGFIIFKVAHLRRYPSDTGRRYAQSGDPIDVLVAGSSLEVATQGSRDNAGALIGASPQWAESHPRSQPSSSGPSLDNSHVLPASGCCRAGVRDKHGDRRDRRGRLPGCRRHRVAGSRPTASGRPPANHPLRGTERDAGCQSRSPEKRMPRLDRSDALRKTPLLAKRTSRWGDSFRPNDPT